MLAMAVLLFGLIPAHAQTPANPNPQPNEAANSNPNQLPPIPGVNSNPAPQQPSQPPQQQGQQQPQQQAQPQPDSQPQAQPLLTPLPPSLANKLSKIQKSAAARVKSPFMLPREIYERLMKKRVDVEAEGFIDMSVEPKRRWALKYYKLVAVIWNVRSPKAMILDRDGKMQLFKEKDYIGNQEGFISEINNGEVVISERGSEIKLKLEK